MSISMWTRTTDSDPSSRVPAETIIRGGRSQPLLQIRELWDYRGVLLSLVWRDVTVRYKQTLLGAAWAIIQPLFSMLVFTLFFSRLAGIPSDGHPYPLFSYTGLLAWTFFANGVITASNSIVDNRHLVSKVYFPRVLIPLTVILASLVDLALAMLVLLGLMFYYGVPPAFQSLTVIGFLALAFSTALGVGLWLSALNAQFRDVRYIVPFLIQLWLFSTPVIYPSSMLPSEWRVVYGLNPMVAAVEGFRWSLLGSEWTPGWGFALSVAASFLLLLSGWIYFRRVETTFADVL